MVQLATQSIPSLHPGPMRGRRGPQPRARDYGIFFVALPLCFALWGAAVGMGPTRTMSLDAALLYNSTHIVAAWWGNGAACLVAAALLRRHRPPLWLILLVGHVLAWLPLYFFYLRHYAYFSSHFHSLLPDAQRPDIGWSVAYVLHTLRYSTFPFLVIWFGAVYGYLYWTGVRFFVPDAARGNPRPAPALAPSVDATPGKAAAAVPQMPPVVSLQPRSEPPGFLKASRLGQDTSIWAIKAEEHYIRIWSAAGTDLVRYRFADAIAELPAAHGSRIHRSWWINWDSAAGWRERGRALEITLCNGLRVPVSLAYKAEALGRLQDASPGTRSGSGG